MGGALNWGYMANGNITVKSFIKLISGSPKLVVIAGANDPVYGLSGQNLKYPQGLGGSATIAAEQYDSVEVIEPGQIGQVTLGGTVVEGGYVKSDGSGFAVAIATTGTTKQQVAGIMLDGGSANEDGTIKVWPFFGFVALS